MLKTIKAKWICPQCKHENTLTLFTDNYYAERSGIVYCDVEDGGCDYAVAYELPYEVKVEPEIFTLTEVKND